MALPVLVVAFNRPDLTARVLDRVRDGSPAAVFAAVDGPRPGAPSDQEDCAAVRGLFAPERWDCPVDHRFAPENLGVRTHIPAAISWFFDHVEAGIIIEDDCLVEPTFFTYCEEVLAAHRDDPEVMHVGASNFQRPGWSADASYYYSRYSHNWGWATWRDAWRKNDIALTSASPERFRSRLEELFPRRRDRRYWWHMFRYARSGKVDTWDYSWMFSIWLNGGRAISPATNLVSNIGFGLASTHTHDPSHRWSAMLTAPAELPLRHPAKRELDTSADEWTSDALYGISRSARTAFVKVRLALLLPIGFRRALKRARAIATQRRKNPRV